MKFLLFVLIILAAGCSSNVSTDEVVRNEIKLREARRDHQLNKITRIEQTWQGDTLSVYYTAAIIANAKDSVINDSLFFIRSKGTVLPFLRNPRTDK